MDLLNTGILAFLILPKLHPFYCFGYFSNIFGGSVEGTGGWVTPISNEPSCHTCILLGYTDVYESMDEGTSWNDISGH